MRRMTVIFAVGFLMVSLSTACGEPVEAPGSGSTADQGLARAPVTNTPASSPRQDIATVSPTTSVPVPTPTVDVAQDPIAQRALAYARRTGAIKSGEPAVRLSRDVTPQELAAWHFGNWNFTPGCVPPLHLVILQGDFDVRGAMPGSLSSEQERPAKFLIFVYDLKIDQMISLSSDPSGGWANQALGDPTLPHPDPASLPTGRPPAQIPCTPITVPGAPAPSPAQP